MRYNNRHRTNTRQEKDQAAYAAVLRDIQRERAIIAAAEAKLTDLETQRIALRNDIQFDAAVDTTVAR